MSVKGIGCVLVFVKGYMVTMGSTCYELCSLVWPIKKENSWLMVHVHCVYHGIKLGFWVYNEGENKPLGTDIFFEGWYVDLAGLIV